MLKQFLRLDLAAPHDRSLYRLKKNSLILQGGEQLDFHTILFTKEDLINKILFEIVSMKPLSRAKAVQIALIFNDACVDVRQLCGELMGVKMFGGLPFELTQVGVFPAFMEDYMTQSEDNRLILDRPWQFQRHLTKRRISSKDLSGIVCPKNVNCVDSISIGSAIHITVVSLGSKRTKIEEKELEEVLALKRDGLSGYRFTTPLAQIINSVPCERCFFISGYPLQNRPLQQVLRLHASLKRTRGTDVLERRSAEKHAQLQGQVQKEAKKLRETQYEIKVEEDNMNRMIKIYTKTLSKCFKSLDYLNRLGVRNISEHFHMLQMEIASKQQEIAAEEEALADMHQQRISKDRSHLYYLQKVSAFRDRVNIEQSKETQKEQDRDEKEAELTEQQTNYYCDPQKHLGMYRESKREESHRRLKACAQRGEFMRQLKSLQSKVDALQFAGIEQKYFDLINL